MSDPEVGGGFTPKNMANAEIYNMQIFISRITN